MAKMGQLALRGGPKASFDGPSRPLPTRAMPRVPFLSQLIAERNHLATQRSRRRAALNEVLQTYDEGGHLSDRRMPPGYRMSVDA